MSNNDPTMQHPERDLDTIEEQAGETETPREAWVVSDFEVTELYHDKDRAIAAYHEARKFNPPEDRDGVVLYFCTPVVPSPKD